MIAQSIIKSFKNYQKASANGKKRRNFLRGFEKKMVYRTTKTENPSTTKRMVEKVLSKFN
jgi:hypothetical protein